MASRTARLQSFQNRIRVNGMTGLKRVMTLGAWLNLYFFWEKKWFFIAMIIGAFMLHMPLPQGLSPEGLIILTMSVVSVILFVTEPVPLPTVALLIIIGQVVLMGHDSSEVAKSLVTDSVLFIAGSLMLAVAVVKQKLDKRIAWLIVRMTGTKTWRVCFGITVVSGLLASFVGEHTVAAMMLPVGITLISLTSDDPKKVRNLAAVLLFSIAYGASVAGIGTPSGGARNAIMIGYWKEFFFDPTNPETFKFIVSYVDWMIHAYPMFLIQVPFVTTILFWTFRPEYRDLSRAVVKLRKMIEEEGPMKAADWMSILIFFLVLLGWVLISGEIGMGTVAVAGAALWVAEAFLDTLAPFGASEGFGLWAAVSVLTTGVTNTMSNGAAVAVLGPIVLKMSVVANESPIILGYITAISSSFAYLTVVGTPACTIVYASGYLKTTDFLKVGWKMAIASTIIMLVAAKVYWPLLGV